MKALFIFMSSKFKSRTPISAKKFLRVGGLLGFVFVLQFLLLPWGARSLGERVGRGLSNATISLRPQSRLQAFQPKQNALPDKERNEEQSFFSSAVLGLGRISDTSSTSLSSRPSASKKSKENSVPRNLSVSKKQVLFYASCGCLRGESFAGNDTEHAGIKVYGGEAVGVQNGDVLTSIMGAKVSSLSDATQVVLSALSKKTKQISGTFERKGKPYTIVVSVPYEAMEASHAP